jgi:hypothetical protein
MGVKTPGPDPRTAVASLSATGLSFQYIDRAEHIYRWLYLQPQHCIDLAVALNGRALPW